MTTGTHTALYRLDPALGRFTVQAFAGGLLAILAHSPTFAVRAYRGCVWRDGDSVGVEVIVPADSLALVDALRPADRREIEERLRQEVLHAAAYPDIRFRAESLTSNQVGAGLFRLRGAGTLECHGVIRSLPVEPLLLVFADGVRLQGALNLRMAEFQIAPVTALGGGIRLRDVVEVRFDLAGVPPEAS